MKQTILTFITKIDKDKRATLIDLLAFIQRDLADNSLLPFSEMTLLHFASFVIMKNSSGNELLVFENNFDGDLPTYLKQLLDVGGAGLQQIYACCLDFSGKAEDLPAFLTQHVVRPNAYHIGNVGRKAKDIQHNQTLRLALEDKLDQGVGNTSTQVREDLQNFSKTLPADLALSTQLPPHQTFWEKFLPWVKVVLAAPFIICLLPGLLFVRWAELREDSDPGTFDNWKVNALMAAENKIAQNHLVSITTIKPGPLRLPVLRVVLFAANLLARTSNKGKLSGIPSIHFAHWSIIENKQLLFLSNFDGSWSSYLDDFIDKASKGLTGVWTNTVGFPKTRFLVFEGATDELRFKAFARNSQVPSQVWYSAYTTLTVQNIDKDSAIRENLSGVRTEAETQEWLKLF